MEVKTIYLIGPPRTGTTLAVSLLSCGDGVLALSEPFLAHSAAQPWVRHRMFSRYQRAAGLVRVRPPRACPLERFRAFLIELARVNGRHTLAIKETFRGGELTPGWRNPELMDRIVTGPDPVIGLIRHPRDAVASSIRLLSWGRGARGWLVRRRWPAIPSFSDATAIVRWAARNYAQFAQWSERHQLKVIRYEDLVRTPAVVLPGICEHLGLAYDARMLNSPERRQRLGGVGAPEVMLQKPRAVNTSSIGRGRGLSDEHVEIIRRDCAEAAALFGYSI